MLIRHPRILFRLFASLSVLAVVTTAALSWGFWAHKEISRQAIESLPSPLRDFFSANAEYIVEHSIDPDQRRFKDKDESYYHYLDIDRYGKYPFSELPHEYQAAVKKFGADSVKKNGLVPWRIAEITDRLSGAMRDGNKRDILYYASDLGHYVADAHVPLHATENYDGQFSGQVGIHSRFESRIPEVYGKDYHFSHDSAMYIENALEKAFQIILTSYTLVDTVLKADAKAKMGFKQHEAYTVVNRGGKTEYVYSEAYYKSFNEKLKGLVEKRMQDAVSALADFWFSAWVKAGKPELPR